MNLILLFSFGIKNMLYKDWPTQGMHLDIVPIYTKRN